MSITRLHRIASIVVLLCAMASLQAAPPKFEVRGALPWHNFLSGPSAWDEKEWREYLDWMKSLDLNYLALHCYTGGLLPHSTYVEPIVRVSYRGVLPQAGFDHSLLPRWGSRPLAIQDLPFGVSSVFPARMRTGAFGSFSAMAAKTNEERYERAQALIRRVIAMAHDRGIQVGIGFEFGMYPPELHAVLPRGLVIPGTQVFDPVSPAAVTILRNTIDDLISAYPGLDWVWLWLTELSEGSAPPQSGMLKALMDREAGFFGQDVSDRVKFNGAWSLGSIREAHSYLKKRSPNTHLAVGGWGGNLQMAGILEGLDRALPTDIAFAILNGRQGQEAQPASLESIARRRTTWAVPWLEGDGKLWHPQPRVSILRDHVSLAAKQGLHGVIALHWRTEDVRANMEAFARFASDPAAAPQVDEFYRKYCAEHYGPDTRELADALADVDRKRLFEPFRSAEFWPYDPAWGRIQPEQRAALARLLELAEPVTAPESGRYASNRRWLAENVRLALLLDEIGTAMAPAYTLRDEWLSSSSSPARLAERRIEARERLVAAPVRRLFLSYAARVRSKGEMGVLMSMGQRLWLEYKDLTRFLQCAERQDSSCR